MLIIKIKNYFCDRACHINRIKYVLSYFRQCVSIKNICLYNFFDILFVYIDIFSNFVSGYIHLSSKVHNFMLIKMVHGKHGFMDSHKIAMLLE